MLSSAIFLHEIIGGNRSGLLENKPHGGCSVSWFSEIPCREGESKIG
jgi:hypothetical protein